MCKGIKTEHKEEEENANDRQKDVGGNGRRTAGAGARAVTKWHFEGM